jgi:hypothetical protein
VPSRRQLVVENLRAQPVEIHYGDEVVVVPRFGRAELAELPGEHGQLAELARRGAIAFRSERVEPPSGGRAPAGAAKPKSKSKPKSRQTSPRGARPRRGSSPKQPEGGT